ncbi:DUF4031 domain-containing protein [Azospirillum sp. Sh1]|uniref:DUF4031 domain-containing protein n=1 Tax=Azospirillum sp. Sh1 TaxID=2607285 RepID=UPI0011EE13D3|nr:DUF4031 domain-containing protein [Azospirillum sp. Sh1]KAA0571111.1 DUF4031 domain-containing protein [Azospirillum sp. Sh1]
MTVYVDDAIHRFGRMLMCHMWADTEEELLAMADRIEVARKWIQGHPTLSHGKHREASWVHFDIAKGKRELALQAGAIATDRYGPVEHTARLDIASGDPARVERGKTMLARVAAIREQNATQPTPQGSLL